MEIIILAVIAVLVFKSFNIIKQIQKNVEDFLRFLIERKNV